MGTPPDPWKNPWKNPQARVFVDRERTTASNPRGPNRESHPLRRKTDKAPEHEAFLRQPAWWLIGATVGTFVFSVLLLMAWVLLFAS